VLDAPSGKELLDPQRVGLTVLGQLPFSPDSRTLWTGNTDATAKVWGWAERTKLLTLKGHFYGVNSLGLSRMAARIGTAR